MAEDLMSLRGSRIQAIKLRLIQQGLQLDDTPTTNTASLPSSASNNSSLSPRLPRPQRPWHNKAQTLPRKSSRRRYQSYFESHTKAPFTLPQLWKHELFLQKLFSCLPVKDLCACALICRVWKRVVEQQRHVWSSSAHVKAVINLKMHYNSDCVLKFVNMCHTRCVREVELWYLNDNHMHQLAQQSAVGLKALKDLYNVSFIMCSIHEEHFQQLLAHCTSLRHVEFHGCNSLTETVLSTSLPPLLSSIVIVDCMQLSNESMAAICQLEARLTRLQLQSYHLSDKIATYFQTKNCPNLCHLSLQHCLQISHYGFANLLVHLTQLTHLDLSGCSQICDDTLDVISNHLKVLEVFECAWCPSVTDVGLECLACDLHCLRHLVLDRCSGITDVGIDYLTSMSKLESLSLRWCPGVNDIVILHVLKMVNLHELCLTGCRVTSKGLLALQQHEKLKHLEVFNLTLKDLPEIVESYREHCPHCNVYF